MNTALIKHCKDAETMGQVDMNSDHRAVRARVELPIDHKTQQMLTTEKPTKQREIGDSGINRSDRDADQNTHKQNHQENDTRDHKQRMKTKNRRQFEQRPWTQNTASIKTKRKESPRSTHARQDWHRQVRQTGRTCSGSSMKISKSTTETRPRGQSQPIQHTMTMPELDDAINHIFSMAKQQTQEVSTLR